MGELIPPLESFEAYRAARMVARLSTIAAVVLGLTCLGLIGLLIALFPLKEIQPMLVSFHSKDEQVVKIEPIARNQTAITQLMEAMARQYVVLRETYDLQTESQRWHQVSLMSSDELNEEFRGLVNPESEASPYKKRLTDKATRSVKILSSTSLAPSAPEVFQVEWVAEDRHGEQVLGTSTWVTTLTVGLEERAYDYEDQFINPIGFTVKHYTVARKGG